MSDVAVQAERLSKLYRIGPRETPSTLGEAITGFFGRLASGGRGPEYSGSRERTATVWALKDVSFEIKRGDVVGIIGPNGAGKSTLLKILSRISEPTSGQARIYGSVGSLLEVGTGFHLELTGRENIYLNGAILGMKARDVKSRLDEIIAFAEVEEFINTPVKHYSTGMYMRLAFAVAAHLEPDILLADEVLAVGDAAFQTKCLRKMREVANQGRTVIFVSHNVASVLQLCSSCILLQRARMTAYGPSEEVVRRYLEGLHVNGSRAGWSLAERKGDGRLRFIDAYLQDRDGNRADGAIAGYPLEIVLEFQAHENLSRVRFMLTIYNHLGIAVTHCNVDAYSRRFRVAKGRGRISCSVSRLPLPHGQYRIAIAAQDDFAELDWVREAVWFAVAGSSFFPRLYMPPASYCTALVEHSWNLQQLTDTGGEAGPGEAM